MKSEEERRRHAARLVDAIYRSPLQTIRALLELSTAPNGPVDDGLPTLIAALNCGE
jgi:hypothetical protein